MASRKHGDVSRIRPRGFSRAATIADPHARIRAILADKSTLVRVRLVPRELLVKKDERSHCNFCERKFRTFSRKVHCRACGEIVCSACYRKKDVQVGVDTVLARLCFNCIDLALTPSPEDTDNDDSMEGSFTNSGKVTLSACSSHMKFVDGLLVEVDASTVPPVATDSFVNLELSQFEDDSDADDTDRESAYGYDSDGDFEFAGRTSGAKSLRASTTSTVSSTGSARDSAYHGLGFVPENENLGDFVTDMKLALSDLEVDVETRRRELLKQYNVASLSCLREFDALCQLVSRTLYCGVAAVAFMGETTQWYKSKLGISQSQLPRNVAFCAQVLDEREPTIVLNATQDPRFCANPLVTGSAHIRFYASAPICDPKTNIVLGSVFVMDPLPKPQVPSRAFEVLAYATAAAEKLLLTEARRARKRRSRQKRLDRVFSEPKLVAGDEHSLTDDDVPNAKKDSLRGDALWSSDPPSRTSARFRSSAGPGIELLDSVSLSTLKHSSRRSSAASDVDEPVSVLGRSAPPKVSTAAAMRDEIRQQLETTKQLLSFFGPRRRKPSYAEVATVVAANAEVEV